MLSFVDTVGNQLCVGNMSQESEAASLKEEYGSKIRVIKDVGDFTYVINFKPEGLDLAIKFQLLG